MVLSARESLLSTVLGTVSVLPPEVISSLAPYAAGSPVLASRTFTMIVGVAVPLHATVGLRHPNTPAVASRIAEVRRSLVVNISIHRPQCGHVARGVEDTRR
jgi:hypothetical protein